jgi:hypothetical protein
LGQGRLEGGAEKEKNARTSRGKLANVRKQVRIEYQMQEGQIPDVQETPSELARVPFLGYPHERAAVVGSANERRRGTSVRAVRRD